MDQSTQNKKSAIRNLIIFVIAINLLGWMGWILAQDGTEESVGLGTLIWLGTPLLVSLLIRLFSKDWEDIGIKPNFKGNGRWYAFSFLVFPVIVAVVLLIGALFGGISLTNFNLGLFLQALAVAFISNFIKNIFEEFAWRGYLTPKVNSLGINTIAGHLLVGLIWGTWHIPYYLALVSKTQLAAYSSQSLAVFLPMVIPGMTVAGIIFGELRLITGSTWPVVLMHTMSNVLILTLLVDGFVEVPRETEILFTPSWEGILTMIIVAMAGLWLFRKRMQNT